MAIRCSCKRDNELGRRFCGSCGAKLAPACTGCGFVNTATDRFCGGCGITTAPAMPKLAAPQALPRTAPPKPPPPKSFIKGRTIPIDRIDDVLVSEARVQVDDTW